MVMSMTSYSLRSSGVSGATFSLMPGTRILPCGVTSLLKRAKRSVIGSCTTAPNTPLCKSAPGPDIEHEK